MPVLHHAHPTFAPLTLTVQTLTSGAPENQADFLRTALLQALSAVTENVGVAGKRELTVALNTLATVTPTLREEGGTVWKLDLGLDPEKLEALALQWCLALATVPPKELPRSQRMVAKLLQRLSQEPTGKPVFDKPRQIILNNTMASLGPGLLQRIGWQTTRLIETGKLPLKLL